MTTTVFERVRSVASDVFGVAPEGISASSSSENVDRWDSIQHLSFVLALEETFQLQLSPEETERIRKVGDAVRLIEEKLAVAGR